jgi:hypothetical protein
MFNKYYLKQAKHKPFSCKIQGLLEFLGIACHNPFRDECCIDFDCCSPKKKNGNWLHISSKNLPLRRKVWYESTAPVGTPGRTFIKKSKWVLFKN